jgi:glycine cleavage system H protein
VKSPENFLYSKTHEWIKFSADQKSAAVGLTDYAQKAQGDIVYVDLPEVGDSVTKGESIGEVESVKTVSEIYSPVSGTIAEINAKVDDEPESVNAEPWETWLFKVNDILDQDTLLSSAEYDRFCQEEQ